MEAWRFGFNDPWVQPSANKFDPTDEDIVAHYLLPRATGVPNAHEHAVIDDDPCSCPPWELLRRHGHGESDQAFFFGPPRDMERNAGRLSRVVSPAAPGGVGGMWRGQKGVDKELVIVRGGDDGDGDARGSGAELTVKFRRYNLTYYRKGDRRSSGWVMHEYHVVHPELRPGAVVARIKITERAKKMGKREQKLREEAAVAGRAAAALVPGPDQPGPSNYFVSESHSDYGHHAAGNAVVASVVGERTSSGGGAHQSVAVVQHGDDGYNDGGVVGVMTVGYYTDFLNAAVEEEDGGINYICGADPPGPSCYLGDLHVAGNALVLSDDGAGTSGHAQPGSDEIVHQQGGVVVGETTNGYYDGKICFNGEGIRHYFNQDAGSTGVEAEDTIEEKKGS